MQLEFDSISKKEWLDKVVKDLKGKPIDGLDWQLGDVSYTPFYHLDDAIPTGVVGNRKKNTWEVGQRILVSDPRSANIEALDALNKGANALLFVLNNEDIALDELLKDIQLEWISTQFEVQSVSLSQAFVDRFSAYCKSNEFDPIKVDCAFKTKIALDRQSFIIGLPESDYSDQALAKILTEINDKIKVIATGSIPTVRLRTTDHFYENIATIRAFKLLSQQLCASYDLDTNDPKIEVHIDASTFVEDENTNKIKSAAQAMAAIIGGVDRLFIYPSDEKETSGGSTFSRRIALNTSHLLQMESYMDNVVDPSAGSYFIEKLTNDIAESAWEMFTNSDD